MRKTLPVWFCLHLVALPQAIAETPTSSSCPYDMVGDRVLFAASFAGWDSLWKSVRAPELGDKIIAGFRKDILPSLIADDETGSATVEERVAVLLDEVNWEALADVPIAAVVWIGDDLIPQIAFRFGTVASNEDPVRSALIELMKVIDGWAPESRFREEEGRAMLTYDLEDEFFEEFEGEDEIELDWLHLESLAGTLWVTLPESLDETMIDKGLRDREGFAELWGRPGWIPQSSFLIDFQAVAEWLISEVEVSEAEWTSSLVLDETAEALFADDQETLEKLRQVHNDMDFLTGTSQDDEPSPFVKLMEICKGLGLLLSLGTDTPQGFENFTIWKPTSGSKIGDLLQTPPLSTAFLSLVKPEMLRASVFSLPSLLEIHDFILESIRLAPDSDQLLAVWEETQKEMDFHLRADLLEALGNELAILTRRTDQASFAGFRLVNNETWVILETGNPDKVRRVLESAEDLVENYQLQPNHTLIEGVTFTQVSGGLLGDAAWGWMEDPGILVVTPTPRSDYFSELIADLRSARGFDLTAHPRWETLQTLWTPDPVGVVYDDLSTTWKQQTDQLMGARMMLSMMGGGDPVIMGVIGLGMEFFSGVPTPEVYLRVDSGDESAAVSRSMLLFPEGDAESSP